MRELSPKGDITRWNRAGLRRFRYIDANAATILEDLRRRLAMMPDLKAWSRIQLPPALSAKDELEQKRLPVEQYRAGRGVTPDWGWEIMRAFARACHVLGEHIDAYANEGYLGTATQWDNLRRLLALIDYHPPPAASATVAIALQAKAAGTVKKGLAVTHSPAEGGAPVTFETLEDIEVDPALNELRVEGYDKNPDKIAQTGRKRTLVLAGRVSGLVIGEPIVLQYKTSGKEELSAHLIGSVDESDEKTTVSVLSDIPHDCTIGGTIVHVKPKERLAVHSPCQVSLTNAEALLLDQPPLGLKSTDPVLIRSGTTYFYRNNIGIHGRSLSFSAIRGTIDLKGTQVSPAVVGDAHFSNGQLMMNGDWRRLQGTTIACVNANVDVVTSIVNSASFDKTTNKTALTLSTGSAAANTKEIWAPPVGPGLWSADLLLDTEKLTSPIETSQPKSTSAGDITVVTCGSAILWARLASISIKPEEKTAKLHPETKWQPAGNGDFWRSATTVFVHFKEPCQLVGWRDNSSGISGKAVTLEPEVKAGLRVGRRIVVEKRGEPEIARLTAVASINGNTLVLTDALPAGATPSNLVLCANVVIAGHGERQPEQILGSGDATQVGQSFVLEETQVSFVADSTFSQGVRSDVEVIVDGRIWTQVMSLREHGPTEPIYIVRTTEEGHLRIEFGDGQTGRRLPTGRNNISIRYRTGVGGAGNLKAGSTVALAHADPFVEEARMPLDATGGSDRQDVERMRRTAPKTLLALERAVSLSDFAALAEGHASVWQARARLSAGEPGRHQLVEVIVVPALGGTKLGALAEELAAYLQARVLPGVAVEVKAYQRIEAGLSIAVEINTSAFVPDDVVQRIRTALSNTFSVERRALGQSLYISEVYEVVENVKGVEASRCVFYEGKKEEPLRSVWAASPHQVVWVDGDNEDNVAIATQRYAR